MWALVLSLTHTQRHRHTYTHTHFYNANFPCKLAAGRSNQLCKQEGKKSYKSHDMSCHVTLCPGWNYTTRASHTNHDISDSDGNRLFPPWSFKQTFYADRKRGLTAVVISRSKVESKEWCVEGSDGYWCMPRGWTREHYVRELTSRLVCSLRLSAL